MRRVRPYIPLDIRIQVAERQVAELVLGRRVPNEWLFQYRKGAPRFSAKINLATLIDKLSEVLGDVLQLDHDPALILRQYKVDRRKPPAAWYTPNANDPDRLIYRVVGDHGQKTTGRKPGATKTVTTKGSDIWLKTKFRRLEQPHKKPKSRIPQRARPWPKRPFAKRRPPASR